MALDKTKLTAEIKAAFDAAKTAATADAASQKLVDGIATAVDNYLKSAEVKGIAVTVTGTAGTQNASVGLS
ncbi:MAG TPA: hypothetical protein VGM88_09335 [Kofleriaceae bacterium]